MVKRADSKIIIDTDCEEEVVLDMSKKLEYDGKNDLVKSVVNIMKPDFGFEFCSMSNTYSSAPFIVGAFGNGTQLLTPHFLFRRRAIIVLHTDFHFCWHSLFK